MRIIPGQARAYDLWAAAVIWATVWAMLTFEPLFVRLLEVGAKIPVGYAKWVAVVSAAVIPMGYFLGAQATHLHQMEHAGETPTWLERKMQTHRWLFIVCGPMIAGVATIAAMVAFGRFVHGG